MNKFKTILLLLLFLAIYFVFSLPYYSGDVKNHLVWAEYILTHGPWGLYEMDFSPFAYPNYPPLAMLLFAASLKLYYLTYQLIWFLNLNVPVFPSNLLPFWQWENTQLAFLKLPQIVATITLSYTLYLLTRFIKPKFSKGMLLIFLLLLNPAVIYLSSIWGQIDLLPICFYLLALYFLFKEKLFLSLILASLALLSKQTVLIFWLIYLLLLMERLGLKKMVIGLFVTGIIFYLSYLPFHSFSLTWPLELYRTNFSLVSYSTSENAINLWGFLYNFQGVDDTQSFINLPLQQWGYLLFGLTFLLSTFIYLQGKFSYEKLFHYLFIITITYFFFLTRMHERYLIPTIVFSSLLLIFNKKYWLGWSFFSILHFLNLYRGLYQPDIVFLNTALKSEIVLRLLVGGYLLLVIYHFYLFAKNINLSERISIDFKKLLWA